MLKQEYMCMTRFQCLKANYDVNQRKLSQHLSDPFPFQSLETILCHIVIIPLPTDSPPPPCSPADPPDYGPAWVLPLLTNLLQLTRFYWNILHPGDHLLLALHPALLALHHPTHLAGDPLTPGLWLGLPHQAALYVAPVHRHQVAGGGVTRAAHNLLCPADWLVLLHLLDLVHCGAVGGKASHSYEVCYYLDERLLPCFTLFTISILALNVPELLAPPDCPLHHLPLHDDDTHLLQDRLALVTPNLVHILTLPPWLSGCSTLPCTHSSHCEGG